ncbi:hypothetical protein [Halorientalis litorea]|jgi:hypothetical protein|uniref:hypothetical protein n=1 Tax=Halorientalis litorea TaxID=2931977 RepID=UPI001FF6A5F6|nr:hypothetical protein [Halorientalis litorea]
MRRPPLPRPDDVREQVGERLPDTPDVPSAPTPTVPDRVTLRRVATGLTVAGTVLTGLGLFARYLLGRGTDSDSDEVSAAARPRTWEYDGPRIAPLVGMTVLALMRLVVERVRDERAATGDA